MIENEGLAPEPAPRPRRAMIHAPVFYTSAALILSFVAFGAFATEQAGALFSALQGFIIADFGWFYIAVVAGFLVFVLFLMFGRYGDVKLGADNDEPEYSYLSWFAMLFSAGMGIGLVFFGVAEPIQHYASPPVGEGSTVESARQAMMLTFFHWGLHAWAIYIVVGLSLAYFSFRRGLPLTIRSALHPLIGERIHGPIGNAVDIFAVLGTMFGIACSLGLGVLQVNSGLTYLLGIPTGSVVQVTVIAAITGLATVSVLAGLDKGVKRLSELNILFAAGLLVFVLLTGSTVFLLQAFMQNLGGYLSSMVSRTFRMYAYEPNAWLGNWTLFYWGWWIAWSPCVGIFIARISRGRTIRGFVGGVLLVPALFSFLWMTVFGNTAIALDMAGAPIAATVKDNISVALFAMLQQLPFPTIVSALAVLLIITFFVTSADSGALVIDMLTSGSVDVSPVWQRVFWTVSAGTVAAVLLVSGGLEALQTALMASALPFAVIMVLMCYCLLRGLQAEATGAPLDLSVDEPVPAIASQRVGWQEQLAAITRQYDRADVIKFVERVGSAALEAVARQLRDHGLSPQITRSDDCVELTIPHGDRATFRYVVRARSYRGPSFVWVETRRNMTSGARHYRAMASSSITASARDVTGYREEQIISDLLKHYARFLGKSFSNTV